jgi:hypothetical protein
MPEDFSVIFDRFSPATGPNFICACKDAATNKKQHTKRRVSDFFMEPGISVSLLVKLFDIRYYNFENPKII